MTLIVLLLTLLSIHIQYRIYVSGRADDRRNNRSETET